MLAIGYENKNRENINEKLLEKSKLLSMCEKETNTNITYFNKQISNEINLLNEFNLLWASNINNQNQDYINQINQEYISTSSMKRANSNLLINRNIIPKNLFNNKINRYLSPKLYTSSNYKKNKKIVANEKTNNRCISPSTTNNSNLNTNTNNNSHSSQFIFENFLINTTLHKNLKLNLNSENNNNIHNINGDNIPILKKDNNKKITTNENQKSNKSIIV